MTSPLDLDGDDETSVILNGAARVSRGELRRQADELFDQLARHGASRVMIQSDDPAHVLRAVDASTRAGADLFITHTSLPAEFVREIIDRFAIQAVLGEHDEYRSADGEPAGARVHMMTSGTTGRPKIAVHTLEKLLSRVRASARVPANREGKWLLTYQTTGFAGLQVMLMAALSRGLIVVPEQRTPAGFYEAAKRAEVTQISGTPTFWRSFLMVAQIGRAHV